MTRRVLLLFFLISLCAGCSKTNSTERTSKPLVPETKIEGDKKIVGNDALTSWAVIASDGKTRLLGLTVPLGLINSLQNEKNDIVRLDIPHQAKNTAFTNHIDVQFSSASNNALKKSSLNLRFYNIAKEERSSINCENRSNTNQDEVPEEYVSGNTCHPQIGEIFTLKEAFQDSDHPTAVFSRTNFVYDKDHMIAIEFFFTLEKLQARKSFTIYIPSPKKVEHAASFPTTLTAIYQPNTDSYDFSTWSYANLNDAN
jgi:hypothetical protein